MSKTEGEGIYSKIAYGVQEIKTIRATQPGPQRQTALWRHSLSHDAGTPFALMQYVHTNPTQIDRLT